MNRYTPDSVTPPGFFIDERLNEIGMSRTTLAARIQSTPELLTGIIGGQVPISLEMARRLEAVFGIPAHFWIDAERLYRKSLAFAAGGQA